jgi:2-methylcitrate dehydratase
MKIASQQVLISIFSPEKVDCIKDCAFSADYHDAGKRSIANALAVEFKLNPAHRFSPVRQDEILTVSLDQAVLEAVPGHQFFDLYVI